MATSRQLPVPFQGEGEGADNGFDWKKWGAAAGLGGAGLFGLGTMDKPDFVNPADRARPWLDQIPEAMRPYYQPYIDRGNRASGALEGQYGEMTSDPGGFINRIGAGYKESPGFQWNLKNALLAGNNASAAGGMLGSPLNVRESQETAEGLASKDYDTWLQHALSQFGLGQAGLSNFSDKGYSASTDYGTSLANNLRNRAGLDYQSAAEENRFNQANSKAQSDTFGDLLALGAKAAPYLLGA